ncbi:MAG: hypothetical protein ACRDWY_14905 [Actinomycetes bacterium]
MDPRRVGGPDELVAGAAEDVPGRHRLRWALAILVVGVGLVVVRPDLSLHADRDTPPPPGDYNPYSSSERNTLSGVSWPARGDLADDRGFVTAALDRVREARSEVSRVYFAGRLDDGSRLLLAGTDVVRGVVATSVHALHVPRGTPLADAQVTEATALVDPQQVLVWAAAGRDGVVRAVVLTRPGPVRFELSARVEFHPTDGTPYRRWTAEAASNGVAIADLGRDTDPIIGVRARGPGVFTLPLVARVARPVSERPVSERPGLRVDGVDAPGYHGPDAQQLERALRAQAGAIVDFDESTAEVLWSGAPWKSRRLALVLLTRADGQRFQALVGQQGEAGFPAGVRALPEPAPSRLPWLLEPFSPDDPTLLLCPTGDGSVIYHRRGTSAQTLQIGSDGVVGLVAPGPSAPSAGGADVTVLDESGHILIRTTLPRSGFDDPLALD